MTLIAAADGSALGNPGPSGWAWYIDDNTWRSGGWSTATNNQAELMAVLSLLEETRDSSDVPLRIICDSQYVIKSLTEWIHSWKARGWRKADGKPVLNMELIRSIDSLLQGRDVTFEWVKGHSGHPLNEMADTLANSTALAFQSGIDFDGGPGFDGQPRTVERPPSRQEPTLF